MYSSKRRTNSQLDVLRHMVCLANRRLGCFDQNKYNEMARECQEVDGILFHKDMAKIKWPRANVKRKNDRIGCQFRDVETSFFFMSVPCLAVFIGLGNQSSANALELDCLYYTTPQPTKPLRLLSKPSKLWSPAPSDKCAVLTQNG